jgi:DNA-binding NtrC family response regulator
MNEIVLSADEPATTILAEFSKLNLYGSCTIFTRALELIKQISRHQATVLIQGETGTGKENAARAIHYLGVRSTCPFVPINCATIADDLLESELFGHEKGAFTDARQTKEGLVAVANGGSLFLDEIDSLSTKAQASLLRFLQTQEYRPVGSKKILRANVRIIAATNADLKHWVKIKKFREDLYFRLNVLNLTMPPLRDRKADMPIIAESMVRRFSKEYDLPVKLLSQQSLQYLQQQDWPGNVRELENTLLRSFLLSAGTFIEINPTVNEALLRCEPDRLDQADENGGYKEMFDFEPNSTESISFQDAKAIAIESFEKKYLGHIMSVTHGNVTLAAKIAGKERRALGKLLQKYHIDKSLYR